MSILRIPTDIYEQIIEQAKAQAPIEACGVLAGADNKVERIYKMTNADASADHFMMTPQEQFAAIKDMRSAGLKMLAIYHSHPETPARPSQEDIRLALTPDVVYVIVSLMDDKLSVRGFLIEDGQVTETPVAIDRRKECE